MLVLPASLVMANWNRPLVITKVAESCGGVGTAALMVALAVSSAGFGSGVAALALTMAELIKLPFEFGCTVKVSCAPALVLSVPMFHSNSVPARATPFVGVAETKVTPDGSVSDTKALVEGDGP